MAIYFKKSEKDIESRCIFGTANAHEAQKRAKNKFFDILNRAKRGEENLGQSGRLSIFGETDGFPSTIHQNKD